MSGVSSSLARVDGNRRVTRSHFTHMSLRQARDQQDHEDVGHDEDRRHPFQLFQLRLR